MKQMLLLSSILVIFYIYGNAQDLTSGLLERTQIDDKYKWDLSDLYSSTGLWKKDLEWVEQNIETYKQYQHKLGNSSTILLQCLRFDNKLDSILNCLRLYADMNRDVDMRSEDNQKMWSAYSSLEAEVNAARSYIQSEIISIPEKTMGQFLAENKDLRVYEHFLTKLLLKKRYILTSEKEELIAQYSKLGDNPYAVFGKFVYAELPFPRIHDDKGTEVLLNRSMSWRARSSPDRSFRKKGYEEYYGTLKQFKGTLAQNLGNLIENRIINANVRGYNSALEAAFDEYHLPVSVYDNLIKTVRENLQPLHHWMNMKKTILGYDTLFIYDTMVSLFSETEKEYSWEEARDLMYESLKPLGSGYVDDIREAYDNRWVDAFPNIGKETGGYSTGPKGPHPYVKMNWGGKGLDFTILVHEFGHYVHGYKLIKKQPYIYRSYPSFLGEIASTTAENVAWAYMIENTKSKDEKRYLTGQFIDLIVLYFYTSAMNAEFERSLYQIVNDKGSLSAESITQVYKELTELYYGKAVTVTDFDAHAWTEWPHFYFGYYIYSYATSFAAAIQISENIRQNGETAARQFIQFLEAGNSDFPVNVINKAGVDLTSPEAIRVVGKKMNELMDVLEEISGK